MPQSVLFHKRGEALRRLVPLGVQAYTDVIDITTFDLW